MRELNQLNKVVLQKFSSRQAYTFIKGQYVPIVMNNVSDESQMTLESRKYYVQSYDFTMLGYLIDDEEFEVNPAIERVAQIIELDQPRLSRRVEKFPKNPDEFEFIFKFLNNNLSLSELIEFRADMSVVSTDNIESFDVEINGDYYGSDIDLIQINTNDILRIDIQKTDETKDSIIVFENRLL
jgi:hypothetical protein